MKTSVSTDGKHAVTTHFNGEVVLWDLQNQSKQIITETANIYSAYFVQNTPYFIWQDALTNEVIVHSLNGDEVKRFPLDFVTYGQVITSDLQLYFAADDEWNLYQVTNNHTNLIAKGYLSLVGSGKLLNLTLSQDNELLLTSGASGKKHGKIPLSEPRGKTNLSGVVTWDTKSTQPHYKFPGNINKTHATLSPDGNYVVSGDEAGGAFVWNAKSNKKKHALASISAGILIRHPNGETEWDNSNLIARPDNFIKPYSNYRGSRIIAIYFIDDTNYFLRFSHDIPYAILYHVDSPLPIKYLPLGREPLPRLNSYLHNQAIATAPQANVLVMPNAHGSGIIVYRYDPEMQELTRDWVGEGPEPRVMTTEAPWWHAAQI